MLWSNLNSARFCVVAEGIICNNLDARIITDFHSSF